MEELRDIEGLDRISSWPLAIGWWFVITMLALLLIGAAVLLYRRYIYRKSWQYNSFVKLQNLEAELGITEQKKILQDLCEELKLIAMSTKTREVCAGLSGKAWLQWLQDHDPHGFDWQSQGALLVEYQYRPTADNYESSQLKDLIAAAKGWVRKC